MIDYNLLTSSVKYWENQGFKKIEVPWIVPDFYAKLFHENPLFSIGGGKSLVGSAEQGFLYLALNGFLAKGNYQAISPCFVA